MSGRLVRPALVAFLVGAAASLVVAGMLAATHERASDGVTDEAQARAGRVAAYEQRALLQEALILTQRTDSIARILRTHAWASDSLLILSDSQLPAWRREGDAALLRRAWAALRPHRDGFRVAVALVSDAYDPAWSARPNQSERSSGIALPGTVDEHTCLLVLQRHRGFLGAFAKARLLARLAEQPDSSGLQFFFSSGEGSLGACGWIASFGMPGRGIRAWLDSTQWRAATHATFDDHAWSRRPWRVDGAAPPLLLSEMLMVDFGPGEAQFSAMLPSQACASAVAAACRRLAFAVGRAPSPIRSAGIFVPEQRVEPVGRFITAAWDPRPRLLDDLRRSIGHDRFGALWRDDRPLADAFRSNVGEPLDDWVHRWMRHSIRRTDEPSGPAPALRTLVVWALPCVAFLLLVMVRSRRSGVGRIS